MRNPGLGRPLIGAGIVLCLVAFASDVISFARIVAVFLLLAMPLLFSGFYRDYFGDYRRRSSKLARRQLRVRWSI
jgi:hypothetical protein